MSEQEQLINAWIDGELEPDQALQAAQLAAADPELQRLSEQLIELKKLRLTHTYQQMTPPMPDDFRESLQAILSSTPEAAPAMESTDAAVTEHWWNSTFARAAALVVAIGTGFIAGKSPLPVNADPLASWSESVFTYQNLYLRETVTQSAATAEQANSLIASAGLTEALSKMGGNTGLIESFHSKGFNFTRAQLLGYNKSKLLQLVYLAETGLPLAFCVMPLAGKDAPPTTHEVSPSGVSATYWRQDGFAYALVGDLPSNEVRDLMNILNKDS